LKTNLLGLCRFVRELFREDVRDLLAQHTTAMGGNRNSTAFSRAQTPQNAMNRIGSAKYGEASRGGLSNDEFRARHSRSVNSTPLIGSVGGNELFGSKLTETNLKGKKNVYSRFG
jgi:hypothetical protein